jgi:hypothetical protein
MKFLYLTLGVYVCALSAQSQPASPAGRLIGEVVAVDAPAGKISMKSDKGTTVQVALTEKTLFLRVPPGEKDLQKASRIKLADIAPGDRVLARGLVSESSDAIAATAVIVMSKAELAQKHERDRAEWQARGAAGRVTSIDASNRKMVLAGGAPGAPPLAVEWDDKTQFRRYAPDSIRFSDAKPGAASDVQPGDQVRVLGEKSEGQIKAEQVVSGTFRQLAGTVASINAQSGEIRVTDLATKKPLVVRLNSDTNMKKIPAEMAAMMGKRMSAASAGGRPGGGPGGPGGGRPGEGRPGGGRGFDLASAVERWPAFAVTDLKPGDALIVAGMSGADQGRVTAITLISGVEPLLTATPDRSANLGGWNFGEIGLPQ